MNEFRYLFSSFHMKDKCLINHLNKKVMLYGAGYCGMLVMDLLTKSNINPVAFLDRDASKQEQFLNGIPIYLPETIRQKDKDVIVLVCMFSKESYIDIKNNLYSFGFENIHHILQYKWDQNLFRNQLLMISPDIDLFRENINNIQKVYDLLQDEKSKDTLKIILKFTLTSEMGKSSHLPIGEQYFAYDIFTNKVDEVFVDCGTHIGYVMEVFIQKSNKSFQKYICYEPDPINVEEIVQKRSGYSKEIANKIEIHNVALSDRNEKVYLKNFNHMNSVIVPDGDIEANTILLDEHIDKIAPTFIKIDVEGFEMKLLTGAIQMLKRYQPIVAVAIYHKESDLWQIPFLLKRILPNHKFFLRSYMNYMETILYAVPATRAR